MGIGNQNNPSRTKLGLYGKVVIVILLVMILVVSATYQIIFQNLGSSRTGLTRFRIASIGTILKQYYTDIGHYPSTSEGLNVLVEAPKGPDGSKWDGPYLLRRYFKDAWGRELQYISPGVHNPKTFDLWSWGSDGKKGGTGVNADIGNWGTRMNHFK